MTGHNARGNKNRWEDVAWREGWKVAGKTASGRREGIIANLSSSNIRLTNPLVATGSLLVSVHLLSFLILLFILRHALLSLILCLPRLLLLILVLFSLSIIHSWITILCILNCLMKELIYIFFIRMRFNVARLFIYWSIVLRVRIDTYMYLKAVQMGT